MSLATLAWLAMASYSIHIIEEYTFNWRNWARAVIAFPLNGTIFTSPTRSSSRSGSRKRCWRRHCRGRRSIFASLMLINAVMFHIFPVVRFKGRFSPGVVTAVVLFFPLGIAMWRRAAGDGSVDPAAIIIGVGGGALLMAAPIVMLNLRSKPYFRQA